MADLKCPDCSGPCYDNRADKAKGKRGSKVPDFKCRDKDCNWVGYGPEGAAAVGATWAEEGVKGAAPAAAPRAPRYTWESFYRTAAACWAMAGKLIGEAHAPDRAMVFGELLRAATADGLVRGEDRPAA